MKKGFALMLSLTFHNAAAEKQKIRIGWFWVYNWYLVGYLSKGENRRNRLVGWL